MYYLYVLYSEEHDEYYVGYSHDPWKRVREHNSGLTESTKGRTWKIVYMEGYISERYARKREQDLKRNRRMNTFLMDRVKKSLE